MKRRGTLLIYNNVVYLLSMPIIDSANFNAALLTCKINGSIISIPSFAKGGSEWVEEGRQKKYP